MFVISLDFELLWGVLDTKGPEYYKNLRNVHKVVPLLLDLFEKYEVCCTWATVGALLCENNDELLKYMPKLKPTYKAQGICNLSSVEYLNSSFVPLLYVPNLIKKILEHRNQELGSHTFSHYYTLEEGQSLQQFEADLEAQNQIMSKYIENCHSIVFPRNQVNPDYLEACKKYEFSVYRGTPSHWAYSSTSKFEQSQLARVFRLVDAYIPLWDCTQKIQKDERSGIVNVPGSLFFRPYSSKFCFFENLKLRRIKKGMTKAAQTGRLFHLWWHPHNFGSNVSKNLEQLEDLLLHFNFLKEKYGFNSMTMYQAGKISQKGLE